MKLFIFFMLLPFVLLSQQTCTDQLYRQYLAGYSKPEPKDAQTWANKKARFCQVLSQIEATNRQNLTYTFAINQFTDLLEEQLTQFVTASFNPESLAEKGPQANLQRVGANAASIDWSLKVSLTSVKNQGSCNSAWAFIATNIYETFLQVQAVPLIELSVEYVLQCTTLYSKNILKKNQESNCYGGKMDYAGSLVKNYGIPLLSKYPYLSGDFITTGAHTTPGICNANSTVMYNADPSVTSFLYYQNVSDIQLQTLLNYAPVGVLIYANTGFMNYASGVYSGCPSFATSYSNINHAVMIYGYDINGNWLIKNQWGTGWGNGGYATISKSNNCALSAWVYQFSSSTPYSGTTSFTVTSFYTTKYQKRYSTSMLFFVILLIMSINL